MIPNPFHRLAGHAPEIRLSTNDFRILLDQLDVPAILINLSKQIIIASNFSFNDMTGFGTDEIYSSNIEKLMPDADVETITDGAVQLWSISRKNRNPIQVAVTAKFLNQTERLALLVIEEKSTKTVELAPAKVNLVNDLVSNLDCLVKENLEELI
jgi:hypothetical protein